MRSSLLTLQRAVYDLLKAQMSCPVYDEVPGDTVPPYVVVGEDTAVDWSTKLEPGMEITQTLHVWSSYRGMKEVKELIDSVVRALTENPLSVEGGVVVAVELAMVETLRDPEGFRHGVVKFRFKVMEV